MAERTKYQQNIIRNYYENRETISLIILDLIMPGMGGRRCLKKLLSLNPDVKVMIASGFLSDGNIDATLEDGALGFINKPYDIKQMLLSVRRVLDA